MRIERNAKLTPSSRGEGDGQINRIKKIKNINNFHSLDLPKIESFKRAPDGDKFHAAQLNPFAGETDPQATNPFLQDSDSDEETTISTSTEKSDLSAKKNNIHPQELNPFETEETDVATIKIPSDTNPFEGPDDAPDLSFREKLPVEVSNVFIDMLNAYLKTNSGDALERANNPRYVRKISQDIANTPLLARFLIMEGEKGKEAMKWRSEPPGKEEFQQMLQAFKSLHKVKGSFYTLLTNFDFAGAGYRLLDDASHQRIITKAAEPSLHRFGKDDIVDMKRKAMTDVLEHYSDPQRSHEPLPEGVLDELIAHYGRVEKDLGQARLSAQKLARKSNLSLNDRGFVDAIARFFHRVKTGERLDRFNNEVAEAGEKFREKMLENLDRVHQQHAPQAVASRTKEMLGEHLKKAHADYAKQMKGRNIYPEDVRADTAARIDAKTEENFHEVLRGIVLGYEKEFVGDMAEAVTSFSTTDYFKGKGLKRSVDNVIDINDTLSDLHQVAQTQHDADVSKVKSRYGEKAVVGLSADFQALQLDFAGRIKKKVLSNYAEVLQRYQQKLDKLRQASPPDSLEDKLKLARKLADLSSRASADLDKIRNHKHAKHLQLQPAELEQVLHKAAEPIQEKITKLLPKPIGIKGMLKSIIVRPFKPSVKNIAIGAAVAGVSTLALVALPAVIAGPVGIALIVGLSVALLGWFGRNAYRSFSQRNELNKLLTQLEQSRGEVEKRDKAS